MVQGLFKGGVYFVQFEPDNWCGNNSRMERIQGNTVIFHMHKNIIFILNHRLGYFSASTLKCEHLVRKYALEKCVLIRERLIALPTFQGYPVCDIKVTGLVFRPCMIKVHMNNK